MHFYTWPTLGKKKAPLFRGQVFFGKQGGANFAVEEVDRGADHKTDTDLTVFYILLALGAFDLHMAPPGR
jgi:hypothetical protein